jgi:osmotically-inducible protein OsmY
MSLPRTDPQVERDVRAELAWEPGLEGQSVAVRVRNGVATLTGSVDAYGKRQLAERCAQRVRGVWAVAEEIDVVLPEDRRVADADLAEAALESLRWNADLDPGRVRIVVQDGVVRLAGTVDRPGQRLEAEDAVRHLAGVRGVVNRLALVRPESPSVCAIRSAGRPRAAPVPSGAG